MNDIISGIPFIIGLLIFAVGVTLALTWLFLPWLLLSRLKEINSRFFELQKATQTSAPHVENIDLNTKRLAELSASQIAAAAKAGKELLETLSEIEKQLRAANAWHERQDTLAQALETNTRPKT